MDQCLCTQQNDKSGHACVRKNLTNARNGELWPTFDLFNNAGSGGIYKVLGFDCRITRAVFPLHNRTVLHVWRKMLVTKELEVFLPMRGAFQCLKLSTLNLAKLQDGG